MGKRRAVVVAVTVLGMASANAATASAHAGRVCRVPRLKGLTLTIARARAAHAGCRLRVGGAALKDAPTQIVERQAPGAHARSSTVTVWLKARVVKTGTGSQGGRLPQAPPEAPPSPPAAREEPCHGSAAYPPEIQRPLVTPGPAELVAGFYLDGGPLVGFSAPGCKRPEPPSGAGTVEVLSVSGTIVATQTAEFGHLIEIPLPPGTYTITGTFGGATICTGATGCAHPTETRSVEIRAGYTSREDFILQIP